MYSTAESRRHDRTQDPNNLTLPPPLQNRNKARVHLHLPILQQKIRTTSRAPPTPARRPPERSTVEMPQCRLRQDDARLSAPRQTRRPREEGAPAAWCGVSPKARRKRDRQTGYVATGTGYGAGIEESRRSGLDVESSGVSVVEER